METMQNIVFGSASADKVQVKLQENNLKLLNSKSFKFTHNANRILFELPIIVYVTKKDIGSTRIISEDDVLNLIESAKHFYKSYLLVYLNNLSQNELSKMRLTFIFLPYNVEIKKAEHLDMMLLYLHHSFKNSKTGKIDFLRSENDFLKLIKNESIADYIPKARKHSYLQVLSHNKKNVKGGI